MTTTTTTCPGWCNRDHEIEARDFDNDLVWHIRELAAGDDDGDRVQLAVDDDDLATTDDVSIWIGGNRLVFSQGRRLQPDDLRTWALMLANGADALEAARALI